MFKSKKIVTVGINPSWDVRCAGRGLQWGGHSTIEAQSIVPAGKALNVSKGLAWLGRASAAAGLWGERDYGQMVTYIAETFESIDVKMTRCEGGTRYNITIVDTEQTREMHLRAPNPLATHKSLELLVNDLGEIVDRNCVCVFAGSMPTDKLLDDCLEIIRKCRSMGAEIVVDASGEALSSIIDDGPVRIIKPNIDELGELLGRKIDDEPDEIIAAARELSDKVELVVVSRGEKGAIAVTAEAAWTSSALADNWEVVSTVGCGDYLLAGLLDGLANDESVGLSLERACRAATARAIGWTDTKTWQQTKEKIEVEVNNIE